LHPEGCKSRHRRLFFQRIHEIGWSNRHK
jgi:hypothetical protein